MTLSIVLQNAENLLKRYLISSEILWVNDLARREEIFQHFDVYRKNKTLKFQTNSGRLFKVSFEKSKSYENKLIVNEQFHSNIFHVG